MRYMMLMQFSRQDGPAAEPISEWLPEEIKAHIEFMGTFNTDLVAAGELVDAKGLADPSQARIIRATDSGVPAVTDGPFPESKEFLAGYWIIDCESDERAVECAAKASTAPGPGGTPLNMPIELRPLMAYAPTDL